MALTFRTGSDVGANGGSASAATLVPTLPTGWAAGDLVVFGCTFSNAGATITATAGWTVQDNTTNSGGAAFASATVWRVMQAGDTAPTITSSSAGKQAWCGAAFTPGAGETIAVDANPAIVVGSTAGTSFTANAATSTDAGDLSIVYNGSRANASGATAVTGAPPAGWTEPTNGDQSTAVGTTTTTRQVGAEFSYQTSVGTGSIAPGASTISQAGASVTCNVHHILFSSTGGAPTTVNDGQHPVAVFPGHGPVGRGKFRISPSVGYIFAISVLVTEALGAGTAYDASVNIQPNPAAGSGSGAASNANISVGAASSAASATGAANDANASILVNASNAAAIGTAYDAVVVPVQNQALGNPQNARHPGRGPSTFRFIQRPGAASPGLGDSSAAAAAGLATGTAYDAQILITSNAAAAAGIGSASDANVSITVNASSALATGTAYDALAVLQENPVRGNVANARHPGRGPSTFRFVQRAPAFSIGETDAGSGLATGVAYDAQVLVTSNAISAISTGAANDVTANVQPNAGSTGTGTAFNGGITIAGTAGSASGSGTVNAGAASVQPNANAGSGTGTAYDATVLTQVNPAIGFAQNARHPGRGPSTFRFTQRTPAFSLGETDATPGLSIGTALDVQVLITCNATSAAGAGSASDANANVRPNAGSTGTGTAFDTGITIVGNSGVATGSGTVSAGAANVMPNADAGLATGTAFDAGIVVVPQVGSRSSQRHPGKGPSTFRFVQRAPAFSIGETDAGTAASTGTAYDAAIQIQANPGSGAGVGSAPDATTKVTCGASTSTATGAAQNPTPALGTVTAAALATAAANQAVAALRVNPATGTVTGTAYLASNGFKLLVDAQPALGAALPDDLWTAKPRIGSTAGANSAVTARPFTGVTFDPG